MKKQFLVFLMTKKGLETLQAFVDSQAIDQIAQVVIGLDKGQDDFSQEIKTLCIQHDIAYYYRLDQRPICNYAYAIAIGWRWMIRDVNELIVIHDSLLPKYRGFAPLVNALLNKENTIGATALFASEKYDQGNIILQKSIQIDYPIKINDAIDLMAALYKLIIQELLVMINTTETLPRIVQDEEKATYSLWRDEDDYRLDWNTTSDDILTKVNALGSPYKGAYTKIKNAKVRIIEVEKVDDITLENRDHGKVIFMVDDKPVVVCGKGLIKIKEAFFEKNQESIFPLKNFRTRFK